MSALGDASTLMLHEADVERLIDIDDVIEAVHGATRDLAGGGAGNQPRRRVFPPKGVLNVMSATWPAGGVSGLKTYVVADGRLWFLIVLLDLSGKPLALVEADVIGQYRTGAATGVAARALCPDGEKVVALIGTGAQARTQALALQHTLDIAEFRVYSRTAARREAFALEVGAVASDSAESAVRDADVVVTMTPSSTPVIESAWVKPGALVVGVGSNVANRSELPADLVRSVDAVVVDQVETAELESGDLILADYPFRDVVGLADVLAGETDIKAGERTVLFESHGLALWDIAAAATVVDAARGQGAGASVPLFSRYRTPEAFDTTYAARAGASGLATEQARERALSSGDGDGAHDRQTGS